MKTHRPRRMRTRPLSPHVCHPTLFSCSKPLGPSFLTAYVPLIVSVCAWLLASHFWMRSLPPQCQSNMSILDIQRQVWDCSPSFTDHIYTVYRLLDIQTPIFLPLLSFAPRHPPAPSPHLERIILRRCLAMEVRANDRDLLEDVLSHTGNLAEEEEGKDARDTSKCACHDRAVHVGQHPKGVREEWKGCRTISCRSPG